MKITFRQLARRDFPRLARWQSRPHVARWWPDPADLASITAEYAPVVDGRDPTEVFILEADARPVGIIQRYRLSDYPRWAAALGLRDGVGIDYYVGEEHLTGRGLGSQAIALFSRDTFARHPDAATVVAAPQQANLASWRALEKAGFARVWAGQLDSDDPADAGPAYVYVLRRDSPQPPRARWRHPNHRELSSLPSELRRTTVPGPVRQWVARQTGAAVLRTARLSGASSTAVHGLYLSDGSRLVLRRYVWRGFLDDEPLAPRREVEALQFAFRRGLPVPEVIAADVSGADVGDGIPVLLMSRLAGRAMAVPDLERLATTLAAIHDTNPAGFTGHEYFAWYQDSEWRPPWASRQPDLWDKAAGLWRDAMPAYRPTFIHRDFHPGNVLWSRRHLTGVVDWANACRGPRGCDIETCRRNLVDLAGPPVADRFVAIYEAITGEPPDPYWEMAAILEAEPSGWTAPSLAEHEPQLARAVGQVLAARRFNRRGGVAPGRP